MIDIHPLLQQKSWRYVDHSRLGLHFNAERSFAYDDTFCSSVGHGESSPVIRSWVHAPTIVLGIQDGKLPFIQQGINYLKRQGYEVIIRNSGGLAVVLDENILNLSLILPERTGIDITRGYEAMWNLIQLTLTDYSVTVNAGEVAGSYCPGSYDLSIDGRKFAGISQRRLRGGVAIQIYICVAGSGSERAHLIRHFYNLSIQNEKTKINYPTIIPHTMASLSELVGKKLTIDMMIVSVLQALNKIGAMISSSPLSKNEQTLFNINYERMLNRNGKSL